jgi:hemolysin activation/secretion protein
LIRDLSWINTNPYRQVNLVYEPGESHGLTDIDLVVSDRKPWRTYAGGDNTGTPVIGRTRWFTGINLENIFFRDHILSFQFTTANAFHEFKSYTFEYAAPLPWRNTIHFFGAYAAINPGSSILKSTGKTYQLSGRYTIPQWFKPNFSLDQITEEIGFDFKGTNNNIIFGEDTTPLVEQLVWIGQFTGSFYLNWDRKGYKVATGIEGYWSPGQMLAHQTPADFNALRAGSTAKYFYSKFLLSLELTKAPIFNFYAQGRAQIANAALLPSEQFALGGYSTVRGYDERVVNGDNAFCTNVEVRTKSFSIASLWTSKVADAMHFLVFFDAGRGWNKTPIAGVPNSQSLMGIGPGLRYQIAPFFILRSDLGFPLLRVANDSGGARLHMSAVLSY